MSRLLKEGDEFTSLEAFLAALRVHEHLSAVTYWRRDSQTIKTARKYVISLPDNPEIAFYKLVYCCNFGGRSYISQSTGKRPNQRTYKGGCGACIKVRATKDAQKLVVQQIVPDHNHNIDKDKYPLLPKCRRLDSAEFADVSKVLETKPNIRILQRHINKVYGKKITLKDVRNISVKWKTSSNANDVETALSILSPNAGTPVEVAIDDNNEPQADVQKDSSHSISTLKNSKCPEKTQTEKYKTAHALWSKVSVLVSEVSMERYRERMKVLNKLVSFWELNKEVCLDLLDKNTKLHEGALSTAPMAGCSRASVCVAVNASSDHALSAQTRGNTTNVLSDHIAEVREMPIKHIIRPIPSELDEEKVKSLIETLQDSNTAKNVPPIDVLWIKGREGGDYYYSIGGCHRYEAHKILKREMINVKLVRSSVQSLHKYLGSSTLDLK